MKTICVYCSSSDAIAPAYFEVARELGAQIAVRGNTLVYGGADLGLMGAVARAVHDGGGRVIGIIPQTLQERGITYDVADETIITRDLRERKAQMAARADAFVTLPGGVGTLEELLETLTLRQLQEHTKPIVLLNANDYYAPLLALFDQEWPHIRAGQAWAIEHAETDGEATRLCSAYPDAAAHCLDLRQHPRERIAWLEAAIEAARRLRNRKAEANHLDNLGVAYNCLGRYQEAIKHHQQALEIAQELDDRQREGVVLGNLGNVYARLGEVSRAIRYHQQALEIARKTGDRWSEGVALGSLGNAYARLGEARRSIKYYKQALEIAREIGDRRSEGVALGNIGLVYGRLGEVERAMQYHQQALEIAREIGDRRGEGAELSNLGNVYADLGEMRQAVEYTQQALEIAREIGDRRGEGDRLGNLGLIYTRLGEVRRAVQYHQQALEIAQEIGDRRGEGAELGYLGNVFLMLKKPAVALSCWRLALIIEEEAEAPWAETHRKQIAELRKWMGVEAFARLEAQVAGGEEEKLKEALMWISARGETLAFDNKWKTMPSLKWDPQWRGGRRR